LLWIMIKVKQHAQAGALPAIAAALALSSTPVWAQEAPPVPTDAAPTTQPAPTTDATPATADTSATTQADSATATPRRTVRPAVAKAVPAATRTATRAAVATRSVASAPAAKARRATAAASAPALLSHRPTPLVDLNAKPTPAATPAVASKPHKKKDATLPIAGGALAFLAIGGAAVAMTRRREDPDEQWTGEEVVASDHVEPGVAAESAVHEEQPAIVAPAAFAWDEAKRSSETSDDGRDGETHVERARRGPTPDNPSLSLKKRLKRAQFFDQRERETAAGDAVPVDPTAGLPQRMVRESEAESA
jgi:resuscitation-promoting factor RpfA